jgi:hypothetical protein
MMFEYSLRATRGDPTREAVSPRAPTDGLENYTSGSIQEAEDLPSRDMIGAQNNHKPEVLINLLKALVWFWIIDET